MSYTRAVLPPRVAAPAGAYGRSSAEAADDEREVAVARVHVPEGDGVVVAPEDVGEPVLDVLRRKPGVALSSMLTPPLTSWPKAIVAKLSPRWATISRSPVAVRATKSERKRTPPICDAALGEAGLGACERVGRRSPASSECKQDADRDAGEREASHGRGL